jgi:hypothetical protein
LASETGGKIKLEINNTFFISKSRTMAIRNQFQKTKFNIKTSIWNLNLKI